MQKAGSNEQKTCEQTRQIRIETLMVLDIVKIAGRVSPDEVLVIKITFGIQKSV